MSNLGNKPVMAANIKRNMQIKGINAKELSKALNVPYTTVLSWTKAEYYPRIDKIEMMADYFGVLKSDLIEDKQKQPAQGEYVILDAQLSKEEFALFGEVRDLTQEEKKRVLDFIKFTKSQREG